MAERTYYDVLQVSPSASDDEIKAAYRSLAWKPNGAEGQDELKLINDAYATLSSPQRRAAYDQALATGATAAFVPAATAPAPVLPAFDSEEERVPKGPLLFRVLGMISNLSWHLSRVRYWYIPITWIIGAMLISGAVALVDEYRLAAHPKALQTTVHEVVKQIPEQKYISVVASADYEDGFTVTGTNFGEYYLLVDAPDIILMKGPKGQASGRFTGAIRAFDTGIVKKLAAEAKDPFWDGANLLTTHYLDANYIPGATGPSLAGLAAVLLALAALFLPALKRYTVFAAGPQHWEEPVGGLLDKLVRVEVVGRFRPEGSKGWGLFHHGVPGVLTAAPSGGFTVSTLIRRQGYELTYEAVIPPGSPVKLGVEYAVGPARAALKVRIPGQTIYLRLDSLQDARLLAQAIRG